MNAIEINYFDKSLRTEYTNTWNIEASAYKCYELSYEEFFNNFMIKNIPCIVKDISTSWECSEKWISGETIDYEYLSCTYGDEVAPVANCSDIQFDSHTKCDMKVLDFLNYLKNDNRNKILYLKDWHLKRAKPEDNFYEVPRVFASDWLNEYAQDKGDDDFRFVYIGPKDSWTPLHADVYSSYSWSVNVIGRKKWIFLPPGEEEKLKDSLGNLPMTVEPDKLKNIVYYEIIQDRGDAIFVPSGWYHQVVNEKDTISINHNWINGCNLSAVWNALTKSLLSVQREIEEFRHTPEYSYQCQLVLKSYFGMDCECFVNMITHIAKKRIKQLDESSSIGLNNCFLGINHIKFDLKSISNVIDLITHHSTFINQEYQIDGDILQLKDTISNLF